PPLSGVGRVGVLRAGWSSAYHQLRANWNVSGAVPAPTFTIVATMSVRNTTMLSVTTPLRVGTNPGAVVSSRMRNGQRPGSTMVLNRTAAPSAFTNATADSEPTITFPSTVTFAASYPGAGC